MILISGDSFSAQHKFPIWPEYLYPNEKIKNLAWHGAGNFYIAESILQYIDSVDANSTTFKIFSKDVNKIIVFWTQFFRIDLPVTQPYDSLHGFAGGRCWQFSGGIDEKSKKWKKLFAPYVKNVGWDSVINNSVHQVKKCLDRLDRTNIDYSFGFVFADENNQQFENHPNFIPITLREFTIQKNILGHDDYHPSPEGHKVIAEAIKPFV